MLTLGIRYLTGRAVASSPDDLDAAEWPPHPARVFMAMAAAHFETGGAQAERAALEWLEALPEPPALRVSEAERRTVTTRFVPVNDRVGISKAPLQSAPGLTRNRAGRTFPAVRPHEDTIFLLWDADVPDRHRRPLEDLCAKVTRIGHSSSLVQMWVEPEPASVEPTLVPGAPRVTDRLRTPSTGLLRELEEAYPAVRPTVSTWTAYGAPAEDGKVVPASVFDDQMIILRLQPQESGPGRLGLEMTARVTRALRGALLHHADESIPEYLSGHSADGSPSRRTHLAWAPLADVGHRHADGHLLGVAAVLPNELDRAERRECVRTIARIDTLLLGRLGKWHLSAVERETPPVALRAETWTQPARQWASASPVVFDRFSYDSEEKRKIVAASCPLMPRQC